MRPKLLPDVMDTAGYSPRPSTLVLLCGVRAKRDHVAEA
jgi:hypothetical protein